MKNRSGFQTHPYMQRRWKQVGCRRGFAGATRSDFVKWRRQTLRVLQQLTGYATMQSAPLHAKITDQIEFPEYVRQRVEIQTEPGIVMPVFVLLPKVGTPPYSAVIAAHGHLSGGKLAVAGCREIPEIAQTIAKHNYDYGVQLVREGFIVFCPDARGFGERQEELDKGKVLASSCTWINNMAYPLGQTVTGMWAWDLHRLVDYIQSRPDCSANRIGCAGLSGGGLQTLWAAALDTRIRCAVISGYFYGYKESLLDLHDNCSCNFVPHLYEFADMGDIAALIAPRPLLVETGTADPLNGASGLANVRSQMRIARRAYTLLDAAALLAHDVFEGGHRWNGGRAIPWLRQHLALPESFPPSAPPPRPNQRGKRR